MFDVDTFVEEMINSGFIKDMPAKELYLGSYGAYNSGFQLRKSGSIL